MTRRRSRTVRRDDMRDRAALFECLRVVALVVIGFYLGYVVALLTRW